jgi:hypothetical protein
LLETGQIWAHEDGRSLAIGPRMSEQYAIGRIFNCTLTFGPLSAPVSVVQDGLAEAGFVLTEATVPDPILPEPEPEAEPEPTV